jgi:hypothetical protein
MTRSASRVFSFCLAAVLLLTACQPAATPTLTPSADALEVVQAYFEAINNQDFDGAAGMVSQYSLDLFGVDRARLIAEFATLKDAGVTFSDFAETARREEASGTLVLDVNLQQQVKDQEPQSLDLSIPLRQEDGQWRVNYNRVIDHRDYQLEPVTVNDVSVQPVRAVRFTTSLLIEFDASSAAPRQVIWGQSEGPVASVTVGGEVINTWLGTNPTGLPSAVKLLPGSTVSGIPVYFQGYPASFPTQVELFEWVLVAHAFGDTVDAWSYTITLEQD